MDQVASLTAEIPEPLQKAQAILAESSQIIGEAYFFRLTEDLARALSVRWVLVGTFSPANPHEATTIVFWDNGPADNFVYDLEFTPCADVAQNGVCSFPAGIVDLFPKDQSLIDMGAQSYAGIPLRASSGEVLGLIAVLDDKPFPDGHFMTEIISLFSGRAAAELERIITSTANERLGKIVEASVSEAYVFNGNTFKFELVNRGARENLGFTMDEMRELTPWDLKPKYSREQFIEFVQPLIKGEVNSLHFETVHERKNGSLYPVSVSLQFFPDAGDVFFASIIDETERKEREEREKMILAEMNHRAKNVLAVVQVIARQTIKRSPENYLERLEERIAALSASHDVLVHNIWQSAPFEDLVRSQIGYFKDVIGDRILMSGPDIKIRASAAQGFGMALHELATNATKYGALSTGSGQVEISWKLIEDSKLGEVVELNWVESGGPAVSEPESRGFGSFIIERSLASNYGCEVSIDFRPTGLICRFRAPSRNILA